MRKSWYYKLLLSYTPVFFLLVSFLVFVFFQILTERAQRDTARLYASINTQMMQSVEQSLRSIDHLMVTLQTRQTSASGFNLLSYFDQQGQPSAFFTYQVIQELNTMRQISPMIHSVYLVRERDKQVLSLNTVAPLEKFPDQPFVEQLLQPDYSYHWTDARQFKEFAASRETQVVSLARKYVTNRGESGLLIVNVPTDALRQQIAQSLDSSTGYLAIEGTGGDPILPAPDQTRKHSALSFIESGYTGWKYESGLLEGAGFSLLQAFSNAWFAVALLVILLGFISIIYVTNRNYKPIRQLIAKLDRMAAGTGDGAGGKENEFHYIESTFSSLVERFNVFKTQSDLNSEYRKKSIFLEMMTGSRSLAGEEWQVETKRLGLPQRFREAAVLIVSIDKYMEVSARFSGQDMLLYQFVIRNVLAELLQKHGLVGWSEWANDRELCALAYRERDKQAALAETIALLADQAMQWIRANLPFTVTVGAGKPTDSTMTLKESYKSAVQAVNARAILGNNRLIGYWETEERSSAQLYDSLEQVRRLLYAFRMMEPDWRAKYAELFLQFREHQLSRDDIANLLQYMTYQLFEQVRGLVLNDAIIETNKAIIRDVIEQFETLEDVQEDLLGILDKLEYVMAERADKGNASALAHRMRQYINDHLANPDLSLVHLSEQFRIPSKNVSALFKEQFHIKFIDFLIHRRVELAKQLLEETELSIQEVGHKVGYLNPVSFNRVFKRVVGVPPGDYRKEKHG